MTRRRDGRTARLALIGVVSAIAAGSLGACAQPGMPPGGPPDDAAPALIAVSPESGAVNVREKLVLLRFDEVVNERSTATAVAPGAGAGGAQGSGFGGASSGAPGLHTVVILSPSDGRERVNWRRTAIEVEPRGGFRPNTAYRVTVMPGLADLRGNRLTERREIVFSTGGSIPTGEIRGVFFDWVAGRATPGARIEVWQAADSTFRWSSRSDAEGRFRIRDLDPGRYVVRGWIDGDNDRQVGIREIHEMAEVDLADSATTDLYAFEHDTIGPRIETIEFIDSTAIRIRFDRAVALGFAPDSNSITLFGSDSARIPLGVAIPAARFDSIAGASTPRDTAGGAPPAAARPAAAPPSAAPPGAAARPPGQAPPQDPRRPQSAVDTAAQVTLPAPDRPIPVRTWVARLGAPLPPGAYLIKAAGLPGLTGAVRPSAREVTLRPPAAPRDSTAPAAPPVRPPVRPPPPSFDGAAAIPLSTQADPPR